MMEWNIVLVCASEQKEVCVFIINLVFSVSCISLYLKICFNLLYFWKIFFYPSFKFLYFLHYISIFSHCFFNCTFFFTSACIFSCIFSLYLLSSVGSLCAPHPAPHPSVLMYAVVTFVCYPGCLLPAVLLCDLTAALPRMGPFIRAKE